MKKILLIIIDGLGDKPIKELQNKTPLEAAKTPNLDWLARNGICGKVSAFRFPKEKEPTSEGTHIALFGYKNYFLGRGVYEVAGIDMNLKKGDVCFRVNFATVDKNLKVIDRRAGRINKTEFLIESLKGIKINGVKFLIKKSYGHRVGLVLRGKNLSSKISDGDPHKIKVRVKRIVPLNNSKEAKFTAEVLNKFLKKTHQILKNHPENLKRKKGGLLPANYLLIRGAGMKKNIPSFLKKYNLKACCIAGGALYKGIAKILGMDLIKVKEANGFATTNLKGKVLASIKALKKPAPHRTRSGAGHNFVFLHIKACDTFSHDGDFSGKKEFIEKIDKNLKPILKLKNTLIIITADHSTCSKLKGHCNVLIPILIFGNGKDKISKFGESFCKKGKLGKIEQKNLMRIILNYSKLC